MGLVPRALKLLVFLSLQGIVVLYGLSQPGSPLKLAVAAGAEGVAFLLFLGPRIFRSKRRRGVLGTLQKGEVSLDIMSRRRFTSLLWLVALTAIIFSPTVIGIPLGGGGVGPSVGTTSPLDKSQDGTSLFLSSLRLSGHTVSITNSSNELTDELAKNDQAALLLIGPDTEVSSEARTIQSRYQNGTLSLLIAEGNNTNHSLLSSTFNASVPGYAIKYLKSPFDNKEAFGVNATIGSEDVPVILNVASPIILKSSPLWPAAVTPISSYDEKNTTQGPRTVLAMGRSGAARSALISDSAAFTNFAYNSTDPAHMSNSTVGQIEKTFTSKLVDWVTGSNQSLRIIYDNSHYTTIQSVSIPGFGFGLRVGPIATFLLESYIRLTSNLYNDFLSGLSGYFRIFYALFLASSLYGAVRKWYASEPRGRDDEPLPAVERSIVAQSKERLDFMKTSRRKGFYVATLSHLYEVLDGIIMQELGKQINSLEPQELLTRLGDKDGNQAIKLFSRLSKINVYANGKKRIIFPPIFRWKATTRKYTRQAEKVLNQLGLTIAGTGESKAMVEYRLRR